MPATHTADFQTAAVKATNLDAVEKINVGIETDKVRKHLNIVADAPEIRIQDKTGSAPEVNATTMAIVADGGATHFRAGTTTFAEGAETKGNVKFQSSTGATTHAEIVGSSGKLELQDGGLGLKLGSNVSVSGTPSAVIQKITGPHARESAVLKRYPEMKMGGLDNQTKAGVTVSSSSTAFNNTGFYNSNVYNQVIANEGWHTSGVPSSASGSAYTIGGVTGEWHKTEFPNKLKVQSFHIAARWGYGGNPGQAPEDLTILGSNDDSTWVSLKSVTGLTYTAYKYTPVHIDATEYYKYLAVVVTDTVDGTSACTIGEMYWMAREYVVAGDDSVDTTVKSVYNAPDLTSAALYIDAAKTGTSVTDQSGSTPSVTVTATGVTYDSTEKAWELTGAATSNIVSGNLASLIGDHPHSVSAWVKADQLNGDGLFHVGTEEGEGDAASRVGFVDDSHISWGGEKHYFSNAEWHNVTYTYNGEGSDKKLYLDGRLVDTAKNEDTFGDYPPFAMTNYSEYGYTVSASSEYSNYSVWEAFDDIYFTSGNSQYFSTSAIRYNTTTGAFLSGNVVAPYLTTVSGTVYNGEWIQMDFPHKLVLDSVEFYPHPSWYGRIPYNGVVAGSNDGGVSWEAIKVFSGFAVTATSWHSMILNSNKGYKSVRIVATAINSSGQNGYLGIDNTRFFGHRENDLVRFPDPTNVLKYPHVAMTGPAQRGYVASASSQYHDGNYPPYNAFNNVFTGSDPTHTWNSKASAYHASSDGEYNGSDNFSTTISGTAYAGEWIQIELPRKVVASALKLGSYGSNSGRSPRAGAFAGSNDGSTWDLLKTYGGETSWTQGTLKSFAPNNNTTTAYKYFRFVITHVQVSNDGLTALQAFEVHGTEPEDVVARVGDGYDGKVRNLRVYSTALSDARVQEIFDADKDEFELAKSSVSVYRGRLGVGTSEPKAALTVMDQVAELEEFPPRAGGFDGDEWYIDGHGTFRANASNYHSSTDYAPGRAFTKSLIVNFGYASQASNSNRWEGNGGLPNLSPASGFDPVGVFEGRRGDWLELELPYRIYVKKFQIQTRLWLGSPRDHPKNGALYGSNDRNTWTELTEFTNLSYTPSELDGIGGHTANWAVNSTSSYKYLRLLTTQKIDGTDDWLMISELRYFGTREQGASTLHNGELSLTRNLTVPRIGPPLDADDTPRRDRLVVEYNTSTNPTENGVVKDTSGRGVDGRLIGGAYYDASEKALVFDGTNDYLAADNIHNPAGDWAHSVSVWLKMRNVAGQSAGPCLYSIGQTALNKASLVYMYDGGTYDLVFASYGDGIKYENDYDFKSGIWYHMCFTYAGGTLGTGSQKVYVNGVELGGAADFESGSGNNAGMQAMNLDANAPLYLSKQAFNHSGNFINGLMSNFKLYDVALTADEVKRLYDMGRCDEGHHVVNFSKTRVGIGLGDGEAPRKQLDIRGSGVCTNRVVVGGGGKETLELPGVGGGEIHVHQRGYAVGSTVTDAAKVQNTALTMHAEGANGNPWSIGVGDGYRLCFIINTSVKGYIANTSGPVQANFTGQHRTFIRDVPFTSAEELEGLIVSSDQNKYIKMSGGIATGSNAITTNESLPVVSLSSEARDKKCFGVISDAEDPENRVDKFGSFVTAFNKERGDTRVHINSVGEGAIWVADINGPLESGDYITTSNIAGYGQKQDGAGLMNYTVAKITMDCDFEPATQPIQRIKQSNVVETHYTGLVQVAKSVPHEFVTTVVSADDAWSNVSVSPSDVTYAEWSNLEANVQNTYTLEYTSTSNMVYDVKYTKTTTANVAAEDAWDAVHVDGKPTVTYAEYSNLEANVQNTYSLTFTRTTTEEKTPSEWSALDANAQALWSIQYYDTVEQKVDADYPGAVAHDTVTDRLENDLDEHGQIQWEDTEETEKAYKIRYLDASGQQTDEANAVHRAAFVGCTYHCG